MKYAISTGEGIDEESFKLLDPDTLKLLIPRAGPRLKFQAQLRQFIADAELVFNTSSGTDVFELDRDCPSSSRSDVVSVDDARTISVEVLTNTPGSSQRQRPSLDIRALVKRKLPQLYKILMGDDKSLITILDKLKINRLVVDSFIEEFRCKPPTRDKQDLAQNIVNSFPILKSSEGEGYVSILFIIVLLNKYG